MPFALVLIFFCQEKFCLAARIDESLTLMNILFFSEVSALSSDTCLGVDYTNDLSFCKTSWQKHSFWHEACVHKCSQVYVTKLMKIIIQTSKKPKTYLCLNL